MSALLHAGWRRVASTGVVVLLAVSCGNDKAPTAPTPPVQTPVVPAPVPQPPPKANLQAPDQPVLSCVTGFCSSLTVSVTNTGPGCATAINLVARAYGADGAPGAAQLGADIPLRLSTGGSLPTFIWKPNVTMLLTSISGFFDVRSAHTVFRISDSHTDVACS